MIRGLRLEVTGTVQGVGFRPWIVRLARELALVGRVSNHVLGVRIDLFGEAVAIEGFMRRLRGQAPEAARIDSLREQPLEFEALDAFTIEASDICGSGRPSIPPDLATCSECLAEIRDPAERRHGYAFATCTACGPRFSIALDVPYDRPATTMAAFEMCEACRSEYEDIEDRRYHAQPIACPACGPRLSLRVGSQTIIDGDPIVLAAQRLRAGQILAIKGLGGYHLACDAGRDDVVRTLRERKRRDAKPFAVMVEDLRAAEQIAELTSKHREVLSGVERPIVLAVRRGQAIAASVAPDTDLIGLMLPYTPLHHLLLAAVERPLVMTSGNSSDEPIAFEDDDALRRLGGIADAMLMHDRPIAMRTDDSVVRIVRDRSMLIRRSRGFVPTPIALRQAVPRSILAVGAHLKNTFCLAADDVAWMGPHIGDLDTPASVDAMAHAIDCMQRFVGIEAEVVAHDLHPSYESTRYALNRTGVELFAVQHHHAHVAATMAEHGLQGPALGLAFDGTGAGDDGSAWGGEFLWLDGGQCERLATFRALALAGGDRAIVEVWRLALALLDDAFAGDPPLDNLRLFDAVPPHGIEVARQMIQKGLNSPKAHGLGRYFDAFGAIGLDRAHSAYEGQIAVLWEQAAGGAGTDSVDPYPYELEISAQPWQIDLRPTARAATGDLLAARGVAWVSARFHATLIAASHDVIRRVIAVRGKVPVVASGGCFINARLTGGLLDVAAGEYDVWLPERVPAGDGGLALGQAAVASALIEAQKG